MAATMQGADTGASPNDARSGWPAAQIAQPDGYTGGGGEGAIVGKMEVAGGHGTTDGAVVPMSPYQADSAPAPAGSNPTGGGSLPNGATVPSFNAVALARKGMGPGNEMPVMARGTPAMARIASGDLRRGMAPIGANCARPSGMTGQQTLAGFARGKGGYVPLDPLGVMGVKQVPGPGTPPAPPMASNGPGAD